MAAPAPIGSIEHLVEGAWLELLTIATSTAEDPVDQAASLADYLTSVFLPAVPSDMKAMALFHLIGGLVVNFASVLELAPEARTLVDEHRLARKSL